MSPFKNLVQTMSVVLVLTLSAVLMTVSTAAAQGGTATIQGFIYWDYNANGQFDGSDEGDGSSTIRISGPITDEVVTGALGAFSFDELPAGTYEVTEIHGQADLLSSTPDVVTVVVADGETATVTFGNYMLTSLLGVVFDDGDEDGSFAFFETGLPGVLVQLVDDANANQIVDEGDEVVASLQTDNLGFFSFTDLAPGPAILVEYDPIGYRSTTPNTIPVTLSFAPGAPVVYEFGDIEDTQVCNNGNGSGSGNGRCDEDFGVMVKYNSGLDVATVEADLADCHATADMVVPQIRLIAASVPPTHAAGALGCIVQLPTIEGVEEDYDATGEFVPDDTWYERYQYAPKITGIDQAWDLSQGDPNVLVAVLDTGVKLEHPDLQGKYIPGYDYIQDDDEPRDDYGHGTHVAGIVGATVGNGEGVAGIANQSRVLVVKVLNENNSGKYSQIAAGIVFAADQGARVINLSLGGTAWSSTLLDAVTYATDKGALVVAAVGNSNSSTPFYPAAFPNVMGIAASDYNDARWSLSNYGDQVSVAAPGVSIFSTEWAGGADYGFRSGTSMAAPHVSGLAALMISCNEDLSATEVRTMIESTAKDLGNEGYDVYFGHGRIDGYAAVEAACDSVKTTPVGIPTPVTALTCLPSCDETDGKMLAFVPGLGSIGQQQMIFQAYSVQNQLEFGVFDAEVGATTFDTVVSGPGEYHFNIYADAQRTGDITGKAVLATLSSLDAGAVNRGWLTLTMAHAEAAFDGVGYSYLVEAVSMDPNEIALNSFKLRLNGDLTVAANSTLHIYGASLRANQVLWPSYPALDPTTYDGEWSLPFDIVLSTGTPATELTVWDGDMDFGDGVSTFDTDDADTVNDQIPQFAVTGSTKAETGQGAGAPKENNPNQGGKFARGESVTMEVVSPTGERYANLNPSGNGEWEKFSLRTTTHPDGCDGTVADYCVTEIPEGRWTLVIHGMDLSNVNSLHFGHAELKAVVAAAALSAPMGDALFETWDVKDEETVSNIDRTDIFLPLLIGGQSAQR